METPEPILADRIDTKDLMLLADLAESPAGWGEAFLVRWVKRRLSDDCPTRVR